MAYDINQRFYELLIHWLIIVKFAINKYRVGCSSKKILKIDELMKQRTRHDNGLIVFHACENAQPASDIQFTM